ncbi:hypothetical protein BDW22DRAFT_1426043 [Trametopsis cervina]|nr:hypothetical protein BDW22DRAFT_1426043 [Trametopsis cervina]
MSYPTQNSTASGFNSYHGFPQQYIGDLHPRSEGTHRPGVQPLPADTTYSLIPRQPEHRAELPSPLTLGDVPFIKARSTFPSNHDPFLDFTCALDSPPLDDLPSGTYFVDPQPALPHESASAPRSIPHAVPSLTQGSPPNPNAYAHSYRTIGRSAPQVSQAFPQLASSPKQTAQ